MAGPALEFPPRPCVGEWPATRECRDDLLWRLTHPPFLPATVAKRSTRALGVRVLLDWLGDQEGPTWQQRWVSSGADAAGAGWRQVPRTWLERRGEGSRTRHDAVIGALSVAIAADVVRPSLPWLVGGGSAHGGLLVRNLAASRDPDGFGRLAAACDATPDVSPVAKSQTLYRAAVIVAAKGGGVADITVGDVAELLTLQSELRASPASGRILFYRLLYELGFLGPAAPPTWRALRTAGQRSPEELIDRYGLVCRPVRDLLVDYLRERQPALDYTSLDSVANFLGKLFWADLERHHPGIDSLHLPADVASAWKRRLRTMKKTVTSPSGERSEVWVERINYRERLTPVRAFYLDLAQLGHRAPGAVGTLGRTLSDRRGGDQPVEVQAAAQGTHGRPHP
jgi:hypothetical protein